jgi:hypothetical protein
MDFAPDPISERLIAIEAVEELPRGAESQELAQAREFAGRVGVAFDSLVLEHFSAHSPSM